MYFFIFYILSKESKSVKELPVRAQQEKVHQGKFYSSTFFCSGLKSHWTWLDVIFWVTRVREGQMLNKTDRSLKFCESGALLSCVVFEKQRHEMQQWKNTPFDIA